jgi:hypothetical protein
MNAVASSGHNFVETPPLSFPGSVRGLRYFSTDGTHDDFKPKLKEQPAQEHSVEDVINNDINTNEVFIYMKVSRPGRTFTYKNQEGPSSVFALSPPQCRVRLLAPSVR